MSLVRSCAWMFTACLVLSNPAMARPDRTKLAVLDLRGKGVAPALVDSLTDVVTVALNQLGVFEVLSRADIQQMLVFEQQRQLMGCESDTSCLAEIGGALGVGLLVNGSIGRVGSSFIVNLNLTDTRTVTVREREQRQVAREDDLAEQVSAAAQFLVRGLLAAAQGALVLRVPEAGANVEIDGRVVGVTPLPRQTLGGGPHTVRVSRKGFVDWAKDVSVEQGQTAILDVSLVPSLEYVEEYNRRARTWRAWGLASAGAGLAGATFGIVGWTWNGRRARAYEADLVGANCQADAQSAPMRDCSRLRDRRESIARFDVAAQAVGWSGAALIALGAYLLINGPSVGVYDQFLPQSGPTVTAAPVAGGGSLAISCSF